ncbi:hypothetical protein [Nocardia sp. NPDC051833]|uniref:hypothetical protein n=1 Tax=Nocardia sp. NPDC051833 TaxID=3155674 RepID=UPI00343EDD23
MTRLFTPAEQGPIRPQRDIGTAELKARLARFTDVGEASEERAEIEAAFGAERLDY